MLQTESTTAHTANVINIQQSVLSQMWASYPHKSRYGAEADIQSSGHLMSTNCRDRQP